MAVLSYAFACSGSRLVCRRQFAIEGNSWNLVAYLRVGECAAAAAAAAAATTTDTTTDTTADATATTKEAQPPPTGDSQAPPDTSFFRSPSFPPRLFQGRARMPLSHPVRPPRPHGHPLADSTPDACPTPAGSGLCGGSFNCPIVAPMCPSKNRPF